VIVPTSKTQDPALVVHRGTVASPRCWSPRLAGNSTPLYLLQRNMSRVFRSIAIGYGKAKRTQIQPLK